METLKALPQNSKRPSTLLPLDHLVSPFTFTCSQDGTISISASAVNWPNLPFASSKEDHAARLNTCLALAKELILDLEAQKYNAREDYLEQLKRYAIRLPTGSQDANFMLADAHIRILRNMFAADGSSLSVALAAKLKTLLEQHIGLRVFYPEMANFYRDVHAGRVEVPLSLDAIEGVIQSITDNTPTVFHPKVKDMMEGTIETLPSESPESPESLTSTASKQIKKAPDPAQPTPPNDPLSDLEPQKARDFTFAGAVNGLWKVFLDGEKVHKNLDGWQKAGGALRPHVNEILDWLHSFLNSN